MSLLAECKTAAEVLEHYKAVKRRTRQWKAPLRVVAAEPAPIQQPEPEPEPVIEQPPVVNIDTEPTPYPKIRDIIELVSIKYSVTKLEIISHRRHKTLVLARQVAMTLARNLTPRTLPEIAKVMGNRDHTTIMYGVGKITKMRESDPAFDAELRDLEAILQKTVQHD